VAKSRVDWGGGKRMKNRCLIGVLVICCIALTGCATSAPSRFYTLNPLSGDQQEYNRERGVGGIIVGVGPVEVPAYLDRPQIVTRIDSNEINLEEFHKWAEPLKDSMGRVLVENLSKLLSRKTVVAYPWKSALDVNYQIVVEVIRFDGNMGDTAHLVAQWYIFDGEGKNKLVSHKSHIEENTKGANVKALVAAQSLALADLSKKIASEINRLSL